MVTGHTRAPTGTAKSYTFSLPEDYCFSSSHLSSFKCHRTYSPLPCHNGSCKCFTGPALAKLKTIYLILEEVQREIFQVTWYLQSWSTFQRQLFKIVQLYSGLKEEKNSWLQIKQHKVYCYNFINSFRVTMQFPTVKSYQPGEYGGLQERRNVNL